jgi:hypothetical protein
MKPRFLLNVTILLVLAFYPVCGWAAERVIEKGDGTVITAITDYESGDVIRIIGSRLTEEDWVELRKMWTVGFHLILDNGQREIPDKALSTNGMVPSPVISVTGPDVVNVGSLVFANNNYLTSVDLPVLKSVGEMAFFSCLSLREYELPKSVESLGDGVFAMCKRLESISVASGNERFKSMNGVLYSADGNTLFAYPAGKKQREFASDASDIRPASFYGAENLERVSFTAADLIGNGAFALCVNLSSVGLPEGLKAIGYGVFDSCKALTAVTLPGSLEWVGDGAFSYCERLSSISVPHGSERFRSVDGVLYSADGDILHAYPAGKSNSRFTSNAKEIKSYAFMYAGNLQIISLPYAVSVGEGAFAWCSSLTTAFLPLADSFGNGAFAWCNSLKLMVLKNQAPAIEEKTFTSGETPFLIVTTEAERSFDLEGWPMGTKLASFRGTATIEPITIKRSGRLTLSLDIEGATDYRWKKDDVFMSGEHGASYDKPEADIGDSGTYGVVFKYDMGSGLVDFEINGIEVIIVQ